MIKESVPQKDITILNPRALNNIASKYIKQNSVEIRKKF